MSEYEERKQARIDRYREKAEKARQERRQLSHESISMLEHIPPGQPILVGHHSEQGHRNLLKRSDQKMEKSIAAAEKADYYEHKAEAAERNTAIFSDDPEALTKLKEKLEGLQVAQTRMKQINAYYRLLPSPITIRKSAGYRGGSSSSPRRGSWATRAGSLRVAKSLPMRKTTVCKFSLTKSPVRNCARN